MMTTTLQKAEIFNIVQTAIADALGISTDEAVAEAALLNDLGAESIDLLDILFRIERQTGLKIKVADIAAYIQGGIPDEEFADENNIISDLGLAHLHKIMPQIDPEAMSGALQAESILKMLTVDNLATMVSERSKLQG